MKPWEVDDWIDTDETGIIENIDYWCPTQKRWVFCPEPCSTGELHDIIRENKNLGTWQFSPSTGRKRLHWSGPSDNTPPKGIK